MTRYRRRSGPHVVLMAVLAGAAALGGCVEALAPPAGFTLVFDLEERSHGWVGGFADYTAGREADLELTAEQRPLPAEAGTGRAFFVSGRNLSDDLFMFIRRRVTGLRPATTYRVHLTVTFVTDAPSGCVGIGGAPGEAVTVKAGAVGAEPVAVPGADGELRMSIDKGNQASGGADAVVLGDVGNGSTVCSGTPWREKVLGTAAPVLATTDRQGVLWLLVGTDSGFEGRTSLYYTRVVAELEPAS